MAKRRKPKLLSKQLRDILEHGPMTRYKLAKESGVDQGQLSRFVLGKGQLTFRTLDKIGAVLRLRLVPVFVLVVMLVAEFVLAVMLVPVFVLAVMLELMWWVLLPVRHRRVVIVPLPESARLLEPSIFCLSFITPCPKH